MDMESDLNCYELVMESDSNKTIDMDVESHQKNTNGLGMESDSNETIDCNVKSDQKE